MKLDASSPMEGTDSEAELGSCYMLVPWSSWDQWNFVRESLFSPSADSVRAALRRIAAWKSRGCLPVAIEVTARLVEIQHTDPFFFAKKAASEVTSSEDLLALLYSITLTRFVNGFTEKVSYFDDHAQKHGKKKHSISNLADAIGLPRMVVDIRHESSHNDLPSLPLVRLASSKAIDWLKSHYWEPQRRAIPDLRKEIRSRLRRMSSSLKAKQDESKNHSLINEKEERLSTVLRMNNKLSSQVTGKLLSSKNKGISAHFSKISKNVAELYSLYPREVTSVLVEVLQTKASALSGSITMDSNSLSNESDPRISSMNESKDMIRKLSRKRPGLLLTMLNEVLEIIEAEEKVIHEEISQIELLSPLVLWLSSTLKGLRNTSHVSLSDEHWISSSSKKSIPKISVKELLRKCLILSSSGNQHLIDASIVLAEILSEDRIIKGTRELVSSLGTQKSRSRQDNCASPPEIQIHLEEESIEQASAKIEFLKSKRKAVDPEPAAKKMRWSVAENWIPCPIGTLPCPLSSTYSVPVLDRSAAVMEDIEVHDRSVLVKREAKRRKENEENGEKAGRRKLGVSPMEGLLLIDGVWRAVGREELLAVQSAVGILV